METIKFSKNSKLNKVLNSIYEDLLTMYDIKEDCIEEIRHYKRAFPKEVDFNIYQYGNALVYTDDIRNLYSEYSTLKRVSDDKLIAIYKRQVGYVANYILSNNK